MARGTGYQMPAANFAPPTAEYSQENEAQFRRRLEQHLATSITQYVEALTLDPVSVADHDILSTQHIDTTPAAVVRGDLIVGQGSPATWTRLALGASATYLRSNGTDAVWATPTTSDVTEGTRLYYTDARARAALSETVTGLDYDNVNGVLSLTSGYVIPTTTQETNWTLAYTFKNDVGRYGFVSRSETTISFDGVDTFTLAPTSTSWSYYRGGVKYTVTGSKTKVLATPMVDQTLYYIYIDATDGTLTSSTSGWNLNDTKVPVATLYWHNSLTPKFLLCDERHTMGIDRAFHREHHFTDGTEYVGGGVPSGYTLNDQTDANKVFALSAATIFDEDLSSELAALTKPNGTSESVYYVAYRTASGKWAWKSSVQAFSFTDLGGGAYGFVEYDNAGTLTQAAANRWVNTYLFLSNVVGNAETPGYSTVATRFLVIVGQNIHTSAASAYAESFASFDLSGFPTAEGYAAYQLTWETAGINNSYRGRCKLARVQRVSGNVINSATTVLASHNTLVGIQGGTAGEYYHLTAAEYAGTWGHGLTPDTTDSYYLGTDALGWRRIYIQHTAARAEGLALVQTLAAADSPRLFFRNSTEGLGWSVRMSGGGTLQFAGNDAVPDSASGTARLSLTTAALHPNTAGLLTLGTSSQPWGVIYGQAASVTRTTTPQLTVGYDGSNYATFAVSSAARLLVTPTGTTPFVRVAVPGSDTAGESGLSLFDSADLRGFNLRLTASTTCNLTLERYYSSAWYTVATVTRSTGALALQGQVSITNTTIPQLFIYYDDTNYGTVGAQSTGYLYLNATTAVYALKPFAVSGSTARLTIGASATSANIGIYLRSEAALTGSTTQVGVYSDATFGSDGTSIRAYVARVRTAAAAYTVTTAYGMYIDDLVQGTDSVITTQYGLRIVNQTKGGTNYAIYTGTGLNLLGDRLFVGAGTITTTNFGVDANGNASQATGTSQSGAFIDTRFDASAVTVLARSLGVRGGLQAVAGTTPTWYSIYVFNPVIGSGASVTDMYGLYLESITGGGTSNWAIYSAGGKVRFSDTVGIGTSPSASAALYIVKPVNQPLTGTTQRGIQIDYTGLAAGTTAAQGIWVRVNTEATSYTVSEVSGIRIADVTKGAGSTITTQYGILIDNQTGGATNYAIYTGTGAVRFGGLVTADAGLTVPSGQTLTVTSATITGLTAASVAAGTFPAGAFAFTGALGVGAAVPTGRALYVGLSLSGESTGAKRGAGIEVEATIATAVSSSVLFAMRLAPSYTLGTGHTGNVLTGLGIATPTESGTGTVASRWQLVIGALSAAATATNYGIEVQNISGGAANYAIKTGTGLVSFGDDVDVASGKVYKVNATQVVAARRTGWTDQTATAARTDLGASPTVGALASFCRALYDDLKTHGLIGN